MCQHDAEAPDITRFRHVFVLRSFWRHVLRSALQPFTDTNQFAHGYTGAEVGQLAATIDVKEDVVRLDIAVNNIALVQKLEPSEGVAEVPTRIADWYLFELLQQRVQRASRDVLHSNDKFLAPLGDCRR